jgi:stage V sporulation protein B
MSSGTFQGMGKPKIPMYLLLAAVVLNMGLNAYLIPLHGINGAAVATSISSAAAGIGALGLVKLLVK